MDIMHFVLYSWMLFRTRQSPNRKKHQATQSIFQVCWPHIISIFKYFIAMLHYHGSSFQNSRIPRPDKIMKDMGEVLVRFCLFHFPVIMAMSSLISKMNHQELASTVGSPARITKCARQPIYGRAARQPVYGRDRGSPINLWESLYHIW